MEEKILALLMKKPGAGLEKLMNTYAGLVYTIVLNKLSAVCPKEDIEECVSSVFFEAFEKRANIDLSKGTIKSFLATIAKRRAIDMYRKNIKEHTAILPLHALGGIPDKSHGCSEPQVLSDAFDTRNLLISSIKALGEPDSEIFIRKYYFGQSTRVIAGLMNFKENTIDKKVSRGLRKLRAIIGADMDFQERMDS